MDDRQKRIKALQVDIISILEKDTYPITLKELAEILETDSRIVMHALNGLRKSKKVESQRRCHNSPTEYFMKRKSQDGITGYRDITKIMGVTQKNGAFYYHGSPTTVQQILRMHNGA